MDTLKTILLAVTAGGGAYLLSFFVLDYFGVGNLFAQALAIFIAFIITVYAFVRFSGTK